jgi:XTP/dITP diphosphohydrolase
MKEKICFATNNANKVREIQQLLGNEFEVVGLADIGCHEELAETQPTIEGNSLQKAEYVWQNYQVNCFADDTGLEVHALNNEPGVYSARYAGPQRNDADNMALLLRNLEGKENRNAHFKTIITLFRNGQQFQFEGIAPGHIGLAPQGMQGFGYDPLFIPQGHSRTFAEMNAQEKNAISHRGIAVRKLIEFLKQ